MKKIKLMWTTLIMNVVVLLLISCSSETSSKWEEIEKEGVITVGTTVTGPPFSFMNPENNEIDGLMIDIVYKVAEELGLEVELETMEFSSLIPAMEADKIDVISAGMAILEERKEMVDFSDVVYSYNIAMVVPEDSDATTVEDLFGQTVGSIQGSGTEQQLKSYSELEVRTYDNFSNTVAELEHGRIDAVFGDSPIIQYYLKESDETFNVINIDKSGWGDVDLGLAVPKGSTDFIQTINEVLKELDENGELDEIISKWDETYDKGDKN